MRALHGCGGFPLAVLLLVCAGTGPSACSSDSGSSGPSAATDTGPTPSDPVMAGGTGTITGQVVDGATRTPIGNADVSLLVNGTKVTIQSSSSSDPDLTGTFAFSGVPSGFHSLKIAASGYAAWQNTVPVSPSQDGTPHTENLGKIGLGKAFTLTVVTTIGGALLPGVTVLAQPSGVTGDCGLQYLYLGSDPVAISPFSPGDQEIAALSNSQGQAILPGLNQCLTYLLVSLPVDTNADGLYDYTAASTTYDGSTNSERTASLALRTARRNDSIALIGTSMDDRRRAAFTARNISDTGPDPGSDMVVHGAGCVYNVSPVQCQAPYPSPDYPSTSVPATGTKSAFKLVFNYPVSATGATVTFIDDLVNPDANGDDVADTGFPQTRVLAAGIVLDATGMIVTVSPPAAGFPKNETISVGPFTATVSGFTTALDVEVYVEDDTASGLGASTVLTADNYGLPTINPFPSSGAPSAYLEFPEYVTGTLRLLSYTTSSGTVIVDGPVFTITPAGFCCVTPYALGEMVFTDGATAVSCSGCGVDPGIRFRVPVTVTTQSGFFPSGITLADGDRVRVDVDISDVTGNRLAKEFDLVVQ